MQSFIISGTPLQAVMKMKHHRELAELLLPVEGLPSVDVNAEDNKGLTALHYAVFAGIERVPTFRYLVEQGARVHLGREPPLLLAMQLQSPELARFLIRRFNDDAIIKTKDFWSRSALHYAAMAPADNSEVARILLELGLDVNEKDDMNRTPLHLAATARNHLMVSNFLLFTLHNEFVFLFIHFPKIMIHRISRLKSSWTTELT